MSPKRNEPIAIVGSACRFAGDASSPSKLWNVLQHPKDLLQEIPESRFNVNAFYHPEGSYHGHSNVKNAYLLNEDISAFDAEFFGIKAAEAKAMDPQQRLLMETTYEGLEAAGMPITNLKGGDTAVYVGVMFNDYACMLLRDFQDIPTYYATGTGQSILSNRISYFFDWHGPSVTIDTACSSSLVAVHMAVQALRAGDSRMAIACGSNLILDPMNFVIESKLKMLSPDGRSRMWDQAANGYARGEGVATLVLKTLSAALEDGDHIECIIRETALNQDGATGGITMPSPSAQEALIRSTYAKAGLDLLSAKDRPQYFEAHGTGTPAGDPTEAEAVYNAFWGAGTLESGLDLNGGNPLYVGSIKTVLGHTEGTAGVAAILKASLSLQNGTIPPNLLFEKLSDRVAPFYKNVEILKSPKTWPDVKGAPRRASVNSFGFGGANAHAILERYVNEPASIDPQLNGDVNIFTPLVFSAFSETSLRANMSCFKDFLLDHRDLNLRNLAWTLRERRSLLPYRAAFTASSVEDLGVQVAAKLEDENTSLGTKSMSAARRTNSRLLGVFTGQGAQYARMGAELIEKSRTARAIIEALESDLANLPDGPTWSLQAEILAAASSSRINEAILSQPLCTALQILLVDILRLAGVEFDAVVGHSSGEIAAAYASGHLTARDAICVAYYRGLHVQKSSSPNGDVKGAMIAVGSSLEDITELCEDEAFLGRLSIAASNSSSSVTVSGDEDAITELQMILDDEKKFNRRLKVDKAYHSKHMLTCYKPYVASLRQCGVNIQAPRTARTCTWFSSVYNRPVDSTMELSDTYWAENMTKPVLFCEALSTALAAGSYDVVLEIGAHPALKGPATQTIQEVLEKEIPYSGVLSRGTSAIGASATALGFLWQHLDKASIDLDAYEGAMNGDKRKFSVIKGLPTYQWNHGNQYWHESRTSRKMRTRPHAVHSLLGDITTDSAPHHMSWRNLLRESQMEWVSGHKVQSQTVFPAAGYLTTALEAARCIAENAGNDIRLIELKDFVIHQALVFSQDDAGIEAFTSMANIARDGNDRIRAKFTYSAAMDTHAEDLTLVASAEIEIQLGKTCASLLPVRKPALSHVVDVEPERFYSALSELGYEFGGRFRSLGGLQRKHYRATCSMQMRPAEEGAAPLLIHPAELDAALQSVILAYSYPHDEQLRNLHLPTTIQQIRINPTLLGGDRNQEESFSIDSAISPRQPGQRGITGHVEVFSQRSSNAVIQIQGASFMPLGGGAAEEDRRVFSRVHWVNSHPDGIEAGQDIPLTEAHRDTVRLLERIATFYLRKFDKEIPANHPMRSEFTTKWYLNYARYIADMVETGKHKWAQEEWLNDTIDDINKASEPFKHLPDVQIMHITGQQMQRVFNGETTILEQFRATDILDRYYANGFGLRESGQWVSRTVKQLVDRYPSMNILEIGAGTGGATKAIFREIGQSFRSYTYTDISAAFFENAATNFSQHRERMIFKTFDAEKDPVSQGFTEGTYDMIVAFFVIHATSDLERALRHIRKMLKPGGFLVVGEGQEGMNGVASSGFIFGTLPGWWLGTDTGRVLSPHVSPQEWDELLRKTGFSGVDASPRKEFEDVLNVFHFVSQAVDEEVQFFREPLSSSWRPSPIKKLAVIGGQTERSLHLVNGVKALLGKDFANQVYHYKSLLDVDYNVVDSDSTVISFTELDEPVFKNITPEAFNAFKSMFQSDKNLLWVTSGRRDDEPFSNMTIGFGRVATHESPGLRLQQLDIADPANTTPQTIAEILLRFHAGKSKKEELLWAVEPEVIFDEHDRQLVARLRPIPELNDRYNSARRTIIHDSDVRKVPVTLQHIEGGHIIKEQSRYELSLIEHCNSEETIELHTLCAVSSALKTMAGYKYLVLGIQPETQKQYLVLSPIQASILKVPTASAIPVEDLGLSNKALLTAVAAQIIAMAAVGPLYKGQTLVAHNVSREIAAAISIEANIMNVDVVFTTDSMDTTPDTWIKLPQYLSRVDLGEVVLAKPSAFLGLSATDTPATENEATMISILPNDCHIMTAKTVLAAKATESTTSTVLVLGDVVRGAIEKVRRYVDKQRPDTTISFSLSELENGKPLQNPLSVLDWRAASVVPVHAARIDTSQMFKSTNATYWIVGMAGALGISLCDWMIGNGARNLVVTSRNPRVAPEWIAAHKRKGATVTVLPCDVTDEAALKAVHQQICENLPPIVGAMNGAMVLRDVSIRNMSFAELSDVIRPKVLGTIHLDRIFYDVDLDFFLLISSINCVIGNLGQANYAAANTFMCSLAAQRRKRGLRAAAMNGGAIMGAGYMERESRRALDLIVQKLHMMRMSEEDWNQSICEGIEASRLDSVAGNELTTGLSDVPYDTPNAPYWFLNPMFSSFIVQQKADSLVKNEGKATASTQDLIQACTSKEDVRKIIEKAFAAQLRNVLQMTMSDTDLLAARSAEIGLDSLVSVDIRSWFLKNVQVSVPVLKIMGDDTMANIVQYAVDNVPGELTPLTSGSEAGEDSSADASATEDGSSVEGWPGLKRSEIPTAATTPLPERVSSSDGGILKLAADGCIDWEQEARPAADLAALPRIANPAPVNPPNVIVLTGASGLLGHHLLNYLLDRTSATKVHCLAVRHLASKLAKNELPLNPRVEYYDGQLADPLLGLSPQQATEIFSQADLVIHNGADTSHLKYFQDLRDSNVGSTKTLTRLCLPRRIPIHYISSAGLAVLFNGPAFPPVRMTGREHSYPTTDGVFGYMSSKWTNERFLEQVHDQYGLPVCIHRPSTILREGEDAIGTRAQLDWVNALLHWARVVEAVPQIKNNTGALDLVRISTACESILSHVLDDSARAKTEVRYAHQVGDIVLPMDRLQDIGREEGKTFVVLPMGEWLAKAVAAGLHPAIATLIEMMDAPGAPDYPRILREPTEA
ncbi:putative polyketide synthase [Clohesyomyces aquaticus]|uniref:Putative polyketide synthase n=1 Tax=Clohesyomyces aquaticus TaxID=1231657 RepID=A0A1Y1YYU2_9PLEO|nr:putative polyketide synthase [Clohesyomyces aquaticus]